jgi:hypothetical protein
VKTFTKPTFAAFALPVLGAATIALGLVTVRVTGWWRPGLAVEGFWYCALLITFSAIPQFRLMFRKLSRGQQLALLSFSVALLAGQFVGGGGDTFPIVRWAMYTSPVSQASAVVYEGITQSGDRVLLRPAELVPSLAHGRFESKLQRAYESSLQSSFPRGTTQFDELLRSIALIYNRGGTHDPIVAVEVFDYSVPTEEYVDRSLHEERLLWRTAV